MSVKGVWDAVAARCDREVIEATGHTASLADDFLLVRKDHHNYVRIPT